MERPLILIRKIRHLTDARYFAAMGVDWISIELTSDPASFVLWHSLRDWVAGVNLAAEVDAKDEMLLAKTIIEAQPEGLILSSAPPSALPQDIVLFFEGIWPYKEPPTKDRYLIRTRESDIPRSEGRDMDPSSILVVSDWNVNDIQSMLHAGYAGGFSLYGGEEEMTGIRDYTLMDEVMTRIRPL